MTSSPSNNETTELNNTQTHTHSYPDLILTRYLYNKDNIAPCLTNAILSHNIDESLFWGFELLLSGFETDAFYMLGVIYRTHFEQCNPDLVKYISYVIDKWLENVYTIEYVLITIILNLTCRECNVCKESPLKICIPVDDIPKYMTQYEYKYDSSIPSNKILQHVCKYSLILGHDDDDDITKREMREDLYEKYNTSWLYYACKSPLWETRVTEYGGIINHDSRTVTFDSDESQDKFYEKYGYDPDEQSIQLQEKCLGVKKV